MWPEEIILSCDIICGTDEKMVWCAFPLSCAKVIFIRDIGQMEALIHNRDKERIRKPKKINQEFPCLKTRVLKTMGGI